MDSTSSPISFPSESESQISHVSKLSLHALYQKYIPQDLIESHVVSPDRDTRDEPLSLEHLEKGPFLDTQTIDAVVQKTMNLFVQVEPEKVDQQTQSVVMNHDCETQYEIIRRDQEIQVGFIGAEKEIQCGLDTIEKSIKDQGIQLNYWELEDAVDQSTQYELSDKPNSVDIMMKDVEIQCEVVVGPGENVVQKDKPELIDVKIQCDVEQKDKLELIDVGIQISSEAICSFTQTTVNDTYNTSTQTSIERIETGIQSDSLHITIGTLERDDTNPQLVWLYDQWIMLKRELSFVEECLKYC